MRMESLRVYNRFKRNNNDNSVDLFTSTWRAQSIEMKLYQQYAGYPAVREKSGKFQTRQKSGNCQGILLWVREN